MSLMSSEVDHVIPGLGKGRLESLTDGIFGTVMTVLDPELSVPIITSSSPVIENSALAVDIRSSCPISLVLRD